MSTYDFSTLYTTLPHHLIKDKLIDLINQTFIRENTQYLACNEECAFFTSDVYNNHNLWSCQKVCFALVYLLDNIFIRFGTIYDKRDDFDFDIVNFIFLDGDVPRRTSYRVYISQLIRFARAFSNLNNFNYRNKALTAKPLRQGYRYFKLRKAFSKFYRRHSALLEKYSVSLKTLLQQGISEP